MPAAEQTRPGKAERAAAADERKIASAITRLCSKRQHNLRYFARLHTSGGSQNRVHWMNTVRVRKADISAWYATRRPLVEKRCRRWFALGVSIGELLIATQPRLSIHTLLERMRQLVLEYEFHFHSKSASQNISLMMGRDEGHFPLRKITPGGGSSIGGGDGSSGGGGKIVLRKQEARHCS